jgi:hypothetical protein
MLLAGFFQLPLTGREQNQELAEREYADLLSEMSDCCLAMRGLRAHLSRLWSITRYAPPGRTRVSQGMQAERCGENSVYVTFHGLKISIMLMIASATSNIRLF